MLDKLSIKQMRLLLLLEQKQNLSRVSDSLNVSQQAVSVQLKLLRNVFHDRLFVRHGHQMIATPKCKRLCEKLKTIIETLEVDAQPEHFTPATINQTIVISATDYAQQSVLTTLLPMIRKEAPGLKLIMKNLEIDSVETSLRESHLDLILSIPDFLPEQIPYKKLFNEQYQCVASRGANIQISQFSDLNQYDHVVVSPVRTNLKGSSEQWFKEQGVDRNIVAALPSFNLIAQYIKGTKLLAFVPLRVLPNPELMTIDLALTPPGFDLVIAWHPKNNHSPVHQWLINKLMQIAEQGGPS